MKLAMEKAVYGGDCLAHADGRAIFVPLTLPGEAVSARINEEKRNFAKAELEEILDPSPHRVAPLCPHFGACGGCHYQQASYPAQLAMKEQILRETLVRSGVAVPAEIGVLSGSPWEYRNRIRLALTPGGFGYRERRSHAILPIRECPIAAPLLLETAKHCASFVAGNSDHGKIAEIELFTNHDQSQILLTLFCESIIAGDTSAWLRSVQAALPAQVAGLRLQVAGGALEPQIVAEAGEPSLTYRVAGEDYMVSQGAFFQVNRRLVDAFAPLITEGRKGAVAWDLYAGVGLFARRLARNFRRVVAVESAPASLVGLQQNLAGTIGTAVASTTLDFLRRNRQEREPAPDFIVLDPPRAGLGAEVTTLLNQIHASDIAYVSCDPATLARDLRALTLERYRIDRITLVDMFPHTFHLETVVQLSRS